MKPYRKFNNFFQIRWKEKLGYPVNPYLYRWTLVLFGFTFRLHHWIKSDDRRFFHNHSCDLISFPLKGVYYNVTPNSKFKCTPGHFWKSKAESWHYLEIPKGGCWTFLICGRPYNKWGFLVNGRKVRPLKYFYKYGIIQGETYQ
jgi:hypothetical protein